MQSHGSYKVYSMFFREFTTLELFILVPAIFAIILQMGLSLCCDDLAICLYGHFFLDMLASRKTMECICIA